MNKRWAIATAILLLLGLLPWGGAAAQGPEPYLVKDINPGSGSSFPGRLAEFSGRLFFMAQDGTHGVEPWVSDGTEAGTVMLKDIRPGSSDSGPSVPTEFGGQVFFWADDGTHGRELWVSDGTEAGTVMLLDINPGSGSSGPSRLTEFGDRLFFRANDGTHGSELWVSDGTPEGTVMLVDINPGSGISYPDGFTEFDGQLFFQADDGTYGAELWTSDGTATGTVMLVDIYPGSNSSFPFEFTEAGDQLFFAATDANGQELWVSDGTPEGTVMLKDICPQSMSPSGDSSGMPSDFVEFGGRLFFSAVDANGREPWVSDGTEMGTVMLKDINPGSIGSSPNWPTEFGGQLFFNARDVTHGRELWVSDGTPEGTVMLVDINPGPEDSWPAGFAEFGNQLFFAAEDANGSELWVSDGTPEGTVMLRDINPGPGSSGPGPFTEAGGQLFFSAQDGTHGPELWALALGWSCGDVLDDFDRGTYVRLGPNWRGATTMGDYRIMEDEVQVLSGGPIYWSPQTYGPEQRACVTLTRIDPQGYHGIMLKVQADRRGRPSWRQGTIGVFYDNYSHQDKAGIETYVPRQGWTTLALFDSPLQPGDQLGGRALADGTVEAYINGVLAGTADAGPFFADKGGSIGLWFMSPGDPHARFDDFAAK